MIDKRQRVIGNIVKPTLRTGIRRAKARAIEGDQSYAGIVGERCARQGLQAAKARAVEVEQWLSSGIAQLDPRDCPATLSSKNPGPHDRIGDERLRIEIRDDGDFTHAKAYLGGLLHKPRATIRSGWGMEITSLRRQDGS
jgi:hypothetical protein